MRLSSSTWDPTSNRLTLLAGREGWEIKSNV